MSIFCHIPNARDQNTLQTREISLISWHYLKKNDHKIQVYTKMLIYRQIKGNTKASNFFPRLQTGEKRTSMIRGANEELKSRHEKLFLPLLSCVDCRSPFKRSAYFSLFCGFLLFFLFFCYQSHAHRAWKFQLARSFISEMG